MGMKFCFLAVEGDQQSNIDAIINAYGYEASSTINVETDWEAVTIQLEQRRDDDGETMVVAVEKNWTVFLAANQSLFDMFQSDNIAERLAKSLATRVFSVCIQSVSGMYCWHVFGPGIRRTVFVTDGFLDVDGNSIPGEPEISGEYNEEDVIEVAALMGIDIDGGFENSDSYLLVPLTNERVELELQRRHRRVPTRPWWKFW